MMVEQYVMNVVKNIKKMNKAFIILILTLSLSACHVTGHKTMNRNSSIILGAIVGSLI